jgi:hypothetical protein
MSEITLNMVYEEIRRLNKKMDFIEELVEEMILRELPKVKFNEEEAEEIRSSIEQMKKGEYATLDELMNA